MITHLFYHQETVEPLCALNSWHSVLPALRPGDELIFLDLGQTLPDNFPAFTSPLPTTRIERIPTTKPEQRSYTYGLNLLLPTARHPWVVLWRSDYIYHQRYFPALLNHLESADFILPYEAFIGGTWTDGDFCRRNFSHILTGPSEWLLQNAHICPVYETMDFPHWAIRKNLYLQAGGMDERLWGYGWQFPHLFRKVRALQGTRLAFDFDMVAFHQHHGGSFGLGNLTPQKHQEMVDGDRKLRVLGSKEAEIAFKSERQTPLRPRHAPAQYQPKTLSTPT